MTTVLTLPEDTRKQLIALAAIVNPDLTEPLNGIRFDGQRAIALDSYCIGLVKLPWPVSVPRSLPASPLVAALKMASKDDPARITFGDRQAVVTVGAPTLPLDDPDEDEGLPDVAVDLTYLDDEGWPGDMVDRAEDNIYGVDRLSYSHHIFDADRLGKIAKLGGGGNVRLETPDTGGVWRVTTPYSRHVLGYLIVSEVETDTRGGAGEAV